MEEYIEISSDSSSSDRTITSDIEMSEVIKKYTVNAVEKQSSIPSCSKHSDNLYTLDDFSDEDMDLSPLEHRMNMKFTNRESENTTEVNFSNKIEEYNPCFSKELNELINSINKPQYNKLDDPIQPKMKKIKLSGLNKELEKAKKAQEKEEKRIAKCQEKELKHALKVVENYIKPDKCLEYITINIDENLLNKKYGDIIKAGLKDGNYKFNCSKEIHPNMISWIREVPMIKNNLLQRELQQEHHYLLIMEFDEFLNHITKETLIEYIQSLLKLKGIHHLSLAVMGYMKKLRKKEINAHLVELQIFCKNIYVKCLDKVEDLVTFIIECTKAVAQIPYKKMKSDSLSCENEFFNGNNKDCVKVDKNGNGLTRLWNQCLRMFPLASLETAEAITSVYPTMESLIKTYEEIDSQDAKEQLLQDIAVRRTAGPLGASKRIGPELSRKIYRFFNYKENCVL